MHAVRLMNVGHGTTVSWAAVVVLACMACGPAPADPGVTLEGSAVAAPGGVSGSTTAPRAAGPATNAPTATAAAPGTTTTYAVRRTNLVDAGYTGRFKATGMVLEKDGTGPVLCLGSILESMPPQCGGPKVVGWSWTKAAHASQGGVQYGLYDVVGRYDGTTVTLTEPAQEQKGGPTIQTVDPFVTPCPAPAGGWRPVHLTTATDAAFSAATALAQKQPGYAMLWIDQNVVIDTSAANTSNAGYNDPTKLILNIATKGDQAAMTRTLRRVWGGSLCVSGAPRTEAELVVIQDSLTRTPGLLSSSVNGRSGSVELDLILATTQLQQQFDTRYGVGVVRLYGALQPVD
jgi:hypothetical protein